MGERQGIESVREGESVGVRERRVISEGLGRRRKNIRHRKQRLAEWVNDDTFKGSTKTLRYDSSDTIKTITRFSKRKYVTMDLNNQHWKSPSAAENTIYI